MLDLSQFQTVKERSLVRVLIADSSTGETLVLQRGGNENFGVGLWEILQGSRDQGETPDQAVQREIQEEIGVDVQPLLEAGNAVLLPVSSDMFAIEHRDGFAEDWSNFNYLLIGTALRETLGPLTLDQDHEALSWVGLAQARTLLGEDPYSAGGQRLLALLPQLPELLGRMSRLTAALLAVN